MAVDPEYRALPFDEAIAFLRDKVNLPSERWSDLLREAHDAAFTVAGVTKAEILNAFREAIDQALADGTTLEDFRKTFDQVVAKHGWSYKGSRGWRTSIIYTTNLAQAHNAGRHRQMTDPDVLAARPYWYYRHGDSQNPRPQHLEWDNLVLPADDPWWETHSPANGWGCSCKKFSLSRAEVEQRDLRIAEEAPDNGTYEWTDEVSGEVREIPTGIDPGFEYTPGGTGSQEARQRILDRQLKRLPDDLRTLAQADIDAARQRDVSDL